MAKNTPMEDYISDNQIECDIFSSLNRFKNEFAKFHSIIVLAQSSTYSSQINIKKTLNSFQLISKFNNSIILIVVMDKVIKTKAKCSLETKKPRIKKKKTIKKNYNSQVLTVLTQSRLMFSMLTSH